MIDYLLLSFSSTVWDSLPSTRPLAQIARDIQGAQRRIGKGVDVLVEQKRSKKLIAWLETSSLILRNQAITEHVIRSDNGDAAILLRWLAESSYALNQPFYSPIEMGILSTSLRKSTPMLRNKAEEVLHQTICQFIECCANDLLACVTIPAFVPRDIA